ncbi:hypothetical protein ACRRTK_015274 [Alexandromys fortis]
MPLNLGKLHCPTRGSGRSLSDRAQRRDYHYQSVMKLVTRCEALCAPALLDGVLGWYFSKSRRSKEVFNRKAKTQGTKTNRTGTLSSIPHHIATPDMALTYLSWQTTRATIKYCFKGTNLQLCSESVAAFEPASPGVSDGQPGLGVTGLLSGSSPSSCHVIKDFLPASPPPARAHRCLPPPPPPPPPSLLQRALLRSRAAAATTAAAGFVLPAEDGSDLFLKASCLQKGVSAPDRPAACRESIHKAQPRCYLAPYAAFPSTEVLYGTIISVPTGYLGDSSLMPIRVNSHLDIQEMEDSIGGHLKLKGRVITLQISYGHCRQSHK